jgi:tetratricopeptide (TPR) repeat protein
MKQIIRLVMLAVVLALSAPLLTQAQTAAAGECTDEAKSAMYNEFIANRKGKTPENPNGNEDTAYAAAKKYMATCPTDDSPQAQYMKKWIASYEVGARKAQFLSAYDKKNYAEVMTVGKQVLADDPNYVRGYLLLGNIGYLASTGGNTSLNTESLEYAKKAIELLNSGKTPDDWKPYLGKEDALSWLNYSIGQTLKEKTPDEALPYLLKAARLNGFLKTVPQTYASIAAAYAEGPYAKQAELYKPFTGKPESPEQKLALANVHQVVDRMIDAYARAIALAGNDEKQKANKTAWTAELTQWYKFRNNNTDTGMPELLAGILQKPLPDVPTPLTSLPPAPATGGSTPPGTPAGGTAPAQPAKPGATTATPAQPANNIAPKATATPTPQPAKPKPKANHTRRN